MKTRRSQSGVALILVLWLLVLLTVTSGTYALMARMDQLEANQLLSGTRARMWAEAGLHLAALELREADETLRLIADGRIYERTLEDAYIEYSVVDERGKLDINATDELTLETLFSNHGLDQEQARLLAAAVMDWKDEDELVRVDGAELDDYLSAGLSVGPANRNFMMVEEILQVMGMSWELFRSIEPGISVYSRATLPDISFAPSEALLALPDITPEEALNFVEQRQSEDLENMMEAVLPNGETAMARGRGLTYSIRVKATMPNGVWEQVEATIRLGGGPSGQPFRVLRWKEGFHN